MRRWGLCLLSVLVVSIAWRVEAREGCAGFLTKAKVCVPAEIVDVTFQDYKAGQPSPLAVAQFQVLAARDERDKLSAQVTDLQRQLLLISVSAAAPAGMKWDNGQYVDLPKTDPVQAPRVKWPSSLQ